MFALVLWENIMVRKDKDNYYLDLAEMTAEETLGKSVSSDEFEIFYRQQIKCGETVLCHVSENDDGVLVSVFSKDEKTLHAQINLKK